MNDSVRVGGSGGGWVRRRLAGSATKVAVAVVVVVVLAGAGTAYAVGRGHHHKAGGKRGALTAVQVATAVSGAAVSELSLSGTVASSQSVTVSPGVAGRVVSVAVVVGQSVQAGQVLVSLGNPVLTAQLAEAQAAVASAQAKLTAAAAGPSPQAVAVAQAEVAKAQVALQAAEQSSQQAPTASGKGQPGSSSGGSVSQASAEAVSEAQAALALAQAQAAQAEAPPSAAAVAPLQAAVTQASDAEVVVEAQIAQESVTAPFAGVVSSLGAVMGEQVTPASPLLTLDGAAVSVQAAVAESDLGLVHPGETATISSPVGGGSVPASVSMVAPAGNPSSLTFGVTISAVSDPPWPVPGEAVTAAVVTGQTTAVLVPSSAVVSINGHPQVFVVHADHTVGLVDVTPGISDGTTTAVAGLGSGSEVVTLGQTYLASGDRVRVTERASTPATVTGSSIGGLLTAPVASAPAGGRRSGTVGTGGTAGTAGAGSGGSTGGRGGRKG